MRHTEARDALRALLAEARALRAQPGFDRGSEEAQALVARAPGAMKAACDELYAETGAVLGPQQCLVCAARDTCLLGSLVIGR